MPLIGTPELVHRPGDRPRDLRAQAAARSGARSGRDARVQGLRDRQGQGRRATTDAAEASPRRAAPAEQPADGRAGRARPRRAPAARAAVGRMAARIRPVGHEDRLTLVEHLDELRSRLIVCARSASSIAFGRVRWQNGALLDIVNRPLETTRHASATARRPRAAGADGAVAGARCGVGARAPAPRPSTALAAPAPRSAPQTAARSQAVRPRPAPPRSAARLGAERKPVTLGRHRAVHHHPHVAPVRYACCSALPSSSTRRTRSCCRPSARSRAPGRAPLMLMVPVLFVGGVVFGYFLVLPPAVKFLQNFNATSSTSWSRRSTTTASSSLTLVSMGIVFQIPMGILALTRLGVVTVEAAAAQPALRDRRHRRHRRCCCPASTR